jgi:hypothetical protein
MLAPAMMKENLFEKPPIAPTQPGCNLFIINELHQGGAKFTTNSG